MKTKFIATTAIAALAVPGAALADGKPSDAGSKGKTTSQQSKSKPKGVGFSLGGVDVTGFTVTDGVVAPFSLDPTSANKHARAFFDPDLTKEFIAGEGTVQVPVADGDKALVRYNGLSSTDALQPTDRVKVIGKVTKVKKGDTTTQRVLDIRKVVITRKAEKPEQPKTETAASKEQQGTSKRSTEGTEHASGPKAVAASTSTAPGQACKTFTKKKAEGQTKSAFAACVSGYKKQLKAAEKAEKTKSTEDKAPNPAQTCANEPKKKAEGQKKSLYSACVSGAKKAEKAAEQS
jgi:hypothetical protein